VESYWTFADDWEVSHLGTAIGSVVVVASMRQLLASLWPVYAQSSNAANKQVLGLLEPFDYLLVSFLPGISEVDIMDPATCEFGLDIS
jgi:hypothetical protein